MLKHVIGFAIFLCCFGIGFLTAHTPAQQQSAPRSAGSGCAFDRGPGTSQDDTGRYSPDPRTSALKILAKPKAAYTWVARDNDTEGTVLLRVTFLANARIGEVSVISSLPDGLTEEAIAAAKRLEFEPARINDRPVSVTKSVEYSFSLY